MVTPDADIPPALQGDLCMIIVPSGRSWNVLKHPLGVVIDDPRFRSLPASLGIHGISEDAAERIANILCTLEPAPPMPSRAALLQSALYNSN